MSKPLYLTDKQIEAGITYCEAQLDYMSPEDQRRELFEQELESLRQMLVERAEGIIKLL